MDRINFSKIVKSLFFRYTLALIGGWASIYIYLNPVPRPGLEYLFCIPLSFSICMLIFGDVIQYHKGGIGFKIFFLIVLIRYIISPVLISKTQYLHYMRRIVTQSSYQLSIIIIIIELFVSFIAIKVAWNYYNNKPPKILMRVDTSSISIVAWSVCLIIILICIVRYDRLIGGIHFLLLNTGSNDIGSFEGISILAVKSFFYIHILMYAKKKYEKGRGIIWVIIVLFAAFINISIYYGDNRSLVLQTAIATIYVFITSFPKFRKIVLISLFPIIIAIMLSMISVRQVGTNISEINNKSEQMNLQFLSENIELYTNGVWPIGSAIDVYSEIPRDSISIKTLYSDFAMNFFPFFIPGLDKFRTIAESNLTTGKLYDLLTNGIGNMLPLAGQMWFYGGEYFGIILDIIVNFIVMFMFIKFETISKEARSVEVKYLYTWLSILFAFTMCYCLITLIWSWSKFGLLLSLLYFANRMVLKDNEIK